MAKKQKKTPTEKYIDKAVKQAVDAADNPTSLHVEGCKFNAVEFDQDAMEAINNIAAGLRENAISMGKVAEVFSASNIKVDSIFRMGGEGS